MVFLGVGLGAVHRLGIPGDDHSGVVDALEFIAAYKTAKITSVAAKGCGDRRGQHGDRCGECCAAAGRRGCVAFCIGASEQSMSAFDFEYEHAKQEGVRFLWQTDAGAAAAPMAGCLNCWNAHAWTMGAGADAGIGVSPGVRSDDPRDRAVAAAGAAVAACGASSWSMGAWWSSARPARRRIRNISPAAIA